VKTWGHGNVASPFLTLALYDGGEWAALVRPVPTDRRPVGLKSQSGGCRIERNILPLLGIVPWPSRQESVIILVPADTTYNSIPFIVLHLLSMSVSALLLQKYCKTTVTVFCLLQLDVRQSSDMHFLC
jgi:hypothetical protein